MSVRYLPEQKYPRKSEGDLQEEDRIKKQVSNLKLRL